MKNILILILLFSSLKGIAQKEIVEDTITKPAITEKGKPDGVKTAVKIGKEGGSISSSDGKIKLIFPKNTLSKKTNISIQPTTNLAPNGNGKSYSMEPSGLLFNEPVKLVFYYNDNETQGNSPLLLGMAMQDEKGLWSCLKKVVTDTNLKTITVPIHHFSSYVNYSWSKLYPSSARVKVNKTLKMQIRTLVPLDEFGSEDDELASLGGVEVEIPETWSVNGIPNGNNSIGFVTISDMRNATYQAPATVPKQDPVAISVEHIYSIPYLNIKVFRLISNVTVYDNAYEVKMESKMIGGSPKAWGGVVTYWDNGSFVVSLDKDKPAVIDIKNNMELMTDNCEKIILNPNSNTGIFHVTGTKQIKITPANPPGQPYPIVEIFFKPHPIELTRFRFTCPPPPGVKESVTGNIDLSQQAMRMFMGTPALPQYIKFIANDEEQTIIESPKGIEGFYYKIWVKKIKEE